MKVTYELPDNTVLAFLNYVYYTDNGMSMAVKSAATEDLRSGEVLKVEPEVTNA